MIGSLQIYKMYVIHIWMFPKIGVPNKPMGFPTKNDHFDVEIGGTTIYGNTHHICLQHPPLKTCLFCKGRMDRDFLENFPWDVWNMGKISAKFRGFFFHFRNSIFLDLKFIFLPWMYLWEMVFFSHPFCCLTIFFQISLIKKILYNKNDHCQFGW